MRTNEMFTGFKIIASWDHVPEPICFKLQNEVVNVNLYI